VIRVLVADDEDMIRTALAMLLRLEPDLDVVAECASGAEALAEAERTRPDVCLLDLEMPGIDGIETAARLLRTIPTRCLVVTRHARPGVLRRALSAGVSGFVPKTTPAVKLAEIIRDVAGGRRYVDPDIAASALTEQDCPLSDRELEVLRVSRTGASIKEIADQVHLAPGTVRNYLSSAMAKLNLASRHAAAHRAWEEGWI
jgi:two-component system, NarL family, response regulator DesR